ncbi:DUF6210 family protein [Sessilibacter corallicola]|uniref:Uncharacterized protein n=1 Tax=Sessilibacter corallicola TaxID=2904075 RepID=A0ABQ0AF36_9GAMM
MTTEICLYSLDQTALIILNDQGVIYHNQTGGGLCAQPRARRILAPISNDPALSNLHRGSLYYKLTEICRDIVGFDTKLADQIDELLKKEISFDCIKVDRTRLDESMEAWVHIVVGAESINLVGFGECKAILTWPNSD